jgi:DNA-binding PadR family transcriptional regulator
MLSPKEAEILDQLSDAKEMYGLEIVRSSNGSVRRGTIYVLLDRLEDKGFVSSRAEKTPGASGMPKRLYRITGSGRSALAALRAAQAAAATILMPVGA